MKIIHVIVGLNVGGAELMLLRLTANMSSSYENIVVSLTDMGRLGEDFKSQGVEVLTLGVKSIVDFPVAFFRLRKLFNKHNPDLVQTWMYHSDFIGGLAARSVGINNIIWNVRNTNLDGRGLGSYWFRRLCALLSHFIPRKVIFVSDSAKLSHEKYGYCLHKSQVVYNGFDLKRFRFNRDSRVEVRKFLGLNENDFVICSVGRFVPEKDHLTFIKAVRNIIESGRNVQALMIGLGVDWDNKEIIKHIEGVEKCFHLVGAQEDINSFLSCADVFCLHSITEGFPNVLGEAMAVGLPCVTTRAGDAEKILNCSNFTVDVGDHERMSDIINEIYSFPYEKRLSLGEDNRARIESGFSLSGIVAQVESIYFDLNGS